MRTVSLAPYRDVLALPGVLRLLVFGVLARVPQTASGVVLALHVVGPLHRGWAAAGLVGTAVTVGMAVGSPWRGRAVDRSGLRRALAPSVVAEAAVWSSAPFVGYHGLLVIALAGGLLGLPIFTVMRQTLAVMTPPAGRRSVMALDSMGVELSYMAGPTAGVLVATLFSTTAALLAVGACMVGSGLALMAFNPPTRTVEAKCTDGPTLPAAGPDRAVLRSPALLAVLAAAAAATVVIVGADVSIVANLRADGALGLTGVLYVAWGVASILGGLVYGALHRPVSPFALLFGLSVLTVPVGLAPGPLTLALTLLPAAALCAPVLSSTSEAIARGVPEQVRGEAMGWHGSALTIGSAVGAPLAGAAIDTWSAGAGFAAAGVAGVVLAATGLVTLRIRRASPAAVPKC
jgi:predicted MFS family arabinose efflux permease